MPNSMYFVLAAVALVGGYYIYGTLVGVASENGKNRTLSRL